jgi:hypothetical protein
MQAFVRRHKLAGAGKAVANLFSDFGCGSYTKLLIELHKDYTDEKHTFNGTGVHLVSLVWISL